MANVFLNAFVYQDLTRKCFTTELPRGDKGKNNLKKNYHIGKNIPILLDPYPSSEREGKIC